MIEFIVSFVLVAAIPLLNWWLARKYPVLKLSPGAATLEELTHKYRKWEGRITFIYLVFCAVATFVIYLFLHFAALWRAQAMQFDAQSFVFFADGPMLWTSALFIALLCSGYVLTPLINYLLKGHYAEYERYTARKLNFDFYRVKKWLVIGVSTLIAVLLLAFFDTYMLASPEGIRFNPILGGERRYVYTDLDEIVTAPILIAPNGDLVYRRVYLLKFKDGTSFSTDSLPENEILHRSPREFISELVKISGRQPIEKAVFQRGEL
jgi:hypothetical protein